MIGFGAPVAVDAAEPAVIGLVVAGATVGAAYATSMRWPRLWSARRLANRARRTELAAEDAVLQDPAFEPAAVKEAAANLHATIIAAWSAQDRRRLRQLLSPALFDEWDRRLTDLRQRKRTNPLRRRGRLKVRFVGLVNRAGETDDRVVVHVRARVDDAVYDSRNRIVFRHADDSGRHTHSEYWTLGKRDGDWILISVETDREGAHHLTAPIVTAPWADDRLHDRAALELAAATKLAPSALAELVPVELSDDLRYAALDLAGFDGRYDPDVLEAATRQALAAWAEAIDGDRRSLTNVAQPGTVDALLHPDLDPRYRLVLRGPHLDHLRIVALRPTAHRPTMTVEATVTARRYLQHRVSGTVAWGNRNRATTFTVRWDLHLTDHRETPWRIARIIPSPPRRRSVLYRWTVGLAREILAVLHAGRDARF